MKRKALKAAFPLTIPVLTGFLFIGIAFGVLFRSKGYGAGWSAFMSTVVLAGSMQFVLIDLIASNASLLTIAFMTLMVNARHLFYGLAILKKYESMGRKKWIAAYELCDETFSLVCSQSPPEGVDETWFYLWIGILNHCYWILGSTLGAVIGSMIHMNTEGIDFAMSALFLVIFVGQWESNKNHFPAVVGVLSAFICRIIFGTNNFIIPTMLCIIVILSVSRAKRKGAVDDE